MRDGRPANAVCLPHVTPRMANGMVPAPDPDGGLSPARKESRIRIRVPVIVKDPEVSEHKEVALTEMIEID